MVDYDTKTIDDFVKSGNAVIFNADKTISSKIKHKNSAVLDDINSVLDNIGNGFESFFSHYTNSHSEEDCERLIEQHPGLKKLVDNYFRFRRKYSSFLDDQGYSPFDNIATSRSAGNIRSGLESALSYSGAWAEYSYNAAKPRVADAAKKGAEMAKTGVAFGLLGIYKTVKFAGLGVLGIASVAANAVKYTAEGLVFVVGKAVSSPAALLSTVLIGSAVFSSYFVATHYFKDKQTVKSAVCSNYAEYPSNHFSYGKRSDYGYDDKAKPSYNDGYNDEIQEEKPKSNTKNIDDPNYYVEKKNDDYFKRQSNEQVSQKKNKNKDLWKDPIDDPGFDPVEHWDQYVR